MADYPRYYVIDGDRAAGIADYWFRISSGGYYHRWDPDSRTWIATPDDRDARDYLSRAVESGDARPVDRADVGKRRG
jgi:hypothetical protein